MGYCCYIQPIDFSKFKRIDIVKSGNGGGLNRLYIGLANNRPLNNGKTKTTDTFYEKEVDAETHNSSFDISEIFGCGYLIFKTLIYVGRSINETISSIIIS